MKVNRFGMSQKIFNDMFVHWYNTQNFIAQALRHNGAKDEALKKLSEANVIAAKTFRDGEEPFPMIEHRETNERLRNEINRELSAQLEASALSS